MADELKLKHRREILEVGGLVLVLESIECDSCKRPAFVCWVEADRKGVESECAFDGRRICDSCIKVAVDEVYGDHD